MNFLFVCTMMALSLVACRDSVPTSDNDTDKSSSDTAAYFPVEPFLRSEVTKVDSLPVGIMAIRETDGERDSGYIQRDRFQELTRLFLDSLPPPSAMRGYFKETSLYDATTGSATFLYTAINPLFPIRRIDVSTLRGEPYDIVKNVYMERTHGKDDSLQLLKMFWKPERNFQIVYLDPVSAAVSKKINVIWDNRD